MGLRIHTNLHALGAMRNLADVSARMQSQYARLGSGLRIQSAADDAAGLGISERMRSELRSYGAAARNIQDGISILTIAEGGVQESLGHLQRIRELALQASNGTLSDDERALLNAEYTERLDELNRLGETTEFNGINVLDVRSTIELAIGVDGELYELKLDGTDKVRKRLDDWTLLDDEGIEEVLEITDTFTERLATTLGEYGGFQNRLASMLRSTTSARDSLASSESRIRDLDYAAATAALMRDAIIQRSASAVLAQANAQPLLALDLLRFPGR